MGKKTKTKTNQKTRLAQPLRGAAAEGLQGAQNLYNDPNMQNLPGGYVPMSDQRQQAYQNMQGPYDMGQMGQQGMDEWSNTMSGQYLDVGANPYMQDIVQRSVGAAMNPIKGQFAGGGRYGSGAFANAAMDTGTATASRLYGDQYQRERQNMMSALGQTGQMQQLSERLLNPQIEEARRLEYTGQQYEADQANQLQEENRQFMWPYMQQQIYESSLAGSPLRQEGDAKSKTVSKEPFDWGAMIGGMFSGPSIGGS